jgi:hypothetical protein
MTKVVVPFHSFAIEHKMSQLYLDFAVLNNCCKIVHEIRCFVSISLNVHPSLIYSK